PEWRRTTNTGALVTTFKIASTSRRLNRETGQWVDGNSLRVRVNCWRALASNVKSSVTRGDPLIVTGRLFTRDWADENGVKRIQYELDAAAIGHDLTRGRAVFERIKANTSTSAIEDPQAQQRIGGELTDPVPEAEAPSQFDDRSFDAVFDQPVELPVGPDDPILPAGRADDGPDLDGPPASSDGLASPDPAGNPGDERQPAEPDDEPEPSGSGDETGSARRRGLRRARVPA
ncbi:MAG: single-stranded DNA-binding protein, partial [Micromonosporaceae bacterium]|nr:single-stranded DNA-binding protein [Micromonosporaceae bacterium]